MKLMNETMCKDGRYRSDSATADGMKSALRSGSIVAYEVYPRRDYC